MNDMVEKVARAVLAFMVEEDPSTTPWDSAPVQGREGLVRLARAAIKAMQEPTQAMVDAVDPFDAVTDGQIGNIWGAMIDEALK